MAGLSPKRLAFCREILVDDNATQAYIRAGYSRNGASQAAEKLLRNRQIKDEIQRRMQRREIQADVTVAEVLELLRQHAANGSTRAVELMGKHIGMWGESAAQGDGWDDLAAEANDGTPRED